MVEIGGYIEFEHYDRPMLHEDGIKLNCGRNCLAYLIKAKRIKKIALPYFLCETVYETCKKYDVDIKSFHVDETMRPIFEKDCEDRWVYVVNYYGQLSSDELIWYKEKYDTLIVDNAQAYFAEPIENIDTLYTCRKFFGVPDGGILYTNEMFDEELEQDVSLQRMHYLLGRFEGKASDYYSEYVENNKSFSTESLKKMSLLTENLLRAIDYEEIKQRRTQNFSVLYDELKDINELLITKVEGAFAYPLKLVNGRNMRNALIKEKIYVPVLWPNVINGDMYSLKCKLALDILPLPCDQRYTTEDMKYICEILRKNYGY